MLTLQTINPQSVSARRVVRVPRPNVLQAVELNHPARMKISIHGRRWGKSVEGMIACICGHGPRGSRHIGAIDGGNIWWVAPTYTIATVIWRMLKRALSEVWLDKSEIEHRIELPGGGSITVRSADNPDSLVGDGLDGLVIDEAAQLAPEVWEEKLRPALSDKTKEGWTWFIGTPRGKQNWLYRVFQRAAELAGWARWQGATTTLTVAQTELDQVRLEVGPHAFRQEYLAEFEDGTTGFFKHEWLRYFTNGAGTYKLKVPSEDRKTVVEVREVPVEKCQRVTMVDLAASLKTQADYTVVSTFAITPAKDLLMIGCDRKRMEGPDQVPAIRRAYDKHKPQGIYIERVGYQLALIQAARRDGLPVHELGRDKDKVSRACLLQARMAGGGVYLPEDAPWRKTVEDELMAFPSSDYHDDVVDTMSDGATFVTNRTGFRVC